MFAMGGLYEHYFKAKIAFLGLKRPILIITIFQLYIIYVLYINKYSIL